MADFSNQQFYEYNSGGLASKPEGFWSKYKRTIVFAVPALLIIAGLVILIVFLFNRNSGQVALQETADTMVDRAVVDCEDSADPELCRSRAYFEVANETGLVDMCNQVLAEAKESCVTNIAFDELNVKICNNLSNDEKQRCSDLVWLALAKNRLDLAACGNIVDTDMQTSCLRVVTQTIQASGHCASYGLENGVCDSYNRLLEAATGDPADCRALNDSVAVSDCLDLITSLDRDQDGLSAYDEFLLGSSDESVDSDGDGYDDATEYLNNFDPTS